MVQQERRDLMNVGLWAIYSLFAALSLIPVIKLDEVRSNPQYRILWILSLLVFSWSILIGTYLIAQDGLFMYYSRLLTYPVVFGISYAIFATSQVYTKQRTPQWLHLLAIIFFFIDVILNLTNTFHLWVVEIPYSDQLTRTLYEEASRGWFFLVHTMVCYILLLKGFFMMLVYLKKKKKDYEDAFPFPLILISLILGITLNIIHIFFFSFDIDPTYIFVVIVTFVLYMIIYKRDFNVNLILSSRKFLFSKMREMYVIADQNHIIIEYSNNLLTRFGNLQLREGETVKEFFRKLKKSAIFYHDISEIKDIEYDAKKAYLHIDDQAYRIDRFRANGELILLYDETLSVKMMHEIDVIRIHDQMSNVYNRNFFEENREKLEKENPNMGLFMIDVDGLKLFNDYLGHREGDKLLIRFSQVLLDLNNVYGDLIPIRFGGDEFVVISKDATHDKLDDIIHRIIENTKHGDPLKHISFSYGKALRRPHELLHTMLKRADQRLYHMKEEKKDYKDSLIQALKNEAKKRGIINQPKDH
jgi:diguanylate cyclase (GGDEF)-like protein